MKKTRSNSMLGLAVGERSILAAEVSSASGGPALGRTGEFNFPESLNWQDPQAVGNALAAFLKENGFTVRNVVFGLPAKWVLSKQMEIPPADAQLAASMLRLQADGEFSAELKDLVYDYAGDPNPSAESTVLLVATPGKHVQALQAVAEAAKLHLVGITATTAALGAATARATKNAMVLSLSPIGLELATQHSNGLSGLRHLGPVSSARPLLVGELRRAASMGGNGHTVANGSSTNGHSTREVVLWDDAGLGESSFSTVGDAAGVKVTSGRLSALGLVGPDGDPGTRNYASAVALAVSGMSGVLPIDFADSRLAPPKTQRVQRRTVILIGSGLVVAVLIVLGLVTINREQSDVDALKNWTVLHRDELKSAQALVDKGDIAKRWHSDEARFLSCLTDLTKAVPEDAQLLGTNLVLHENMKGVFTGKSANNDASAFRLVDRLQASKSFKDVKMSTDVHEAGRNGREVSFIISFTYMPGKTASSKPAAQPAAAR